MTALPARYSFLTKPPGVPAMLAEAIKEFGVVEGAAGANNPRILKWADEVAKAMPTAYNNWAADWYNSDAVPWCGLFAAACAVRSAKGATDRLPPKNYLSALAWSAWGVPVQFKGREGFRLNEILVGDVAVFIRNGGGHVASVVGVTPDSRSIICLGGNQEDAVSIKSFPVARIYAVRRPPYKVRPAGARHVRLSSTGIANSTKED